MLYCIIGTRHKFYIEFSDNWNPVLIYTKAIRIADFAMIATDVWNDLRASVPRSVTRTSTDKYRLLYNSILGKGDEINYTTISGRHGNMWQCKRLIPLLVLSSPSCDSTLPLPPYAWCACRFALFHSRLVQEPFVIANAIPTAVSL